MVGNQVIILTDASVKEAIADYLNKHFKTGICVKVEKWDDHDGGIEAEFEQVSGLGSEGGVVRQAA